MTRKPSRHSEVGSFWSILGMYSQASKEDRVDGMAAYAGYRSIMEAFSKAYNTPIGTVTGIFSALSPVNDYWGSLRSLKSVLEGVASGLKVDEITVTTTHRNRQNAYDIATGYPPESKLNGKKVWNFHNNILDPSNPDYVTIDRHALSVWLGRRSLDGRVANYELVASDYFIAAKMLEILPCQAQAICWLGYKRYAGIVFDDHPDFFYAGSNLRTTIRVKEVAAFPPKLRSNQRKAKSKTLIPPILQASLQI